MDKFAQIAQLMLDLAAEGIQQEKLDIHEAALVVLLSKARTLRRTEAACVQGGAQSAAEREHCHRATVYRRVKKSRELRICATNE